MSYGFEIFTPDGPRNLLDVLSAQVVYEKIHTTQYGSDVVSGNVTSENAIGLCIPQDEKLPLGGVEVGSAVVTWAPESGDFSDSPYTENFILRIYRIL